MSNLELFFDLVFVYVITQVTAWLAGHLNPLGAWQSFLLLAPFWWAWVAYSWLGTTVAVNQGILRVLMVGAMGVLMIGALNISQVFLPGDPGQAGALWFVTALALVRLLHLGLFFLVGRGSPGLAQALGSFSGPVVLALGIFIFGRLFRRLGSENGGCF